MTTTDTPTPKYTVPGVGQDAAGDVATALQDRLVSLLDLTLTLKHIHWNVVGPMFISVHEMLDPQYAAVSAMVDAMAERIATMGTSPNGLVGHVVATRRWAEDPNTRAQVPVHLRALDSVYDGVIADHRRAIDEIGKLDPISEDLLIGQTRELELFQWFVRAHLESTDGSLERSSDPSSSGPAPADQRIAPEG